MRGAAPCRRRGGYGVGQGGGGVPLGMPLPWACPGVHHPTLPNPVPTTAPTRLPTPQERASGLNAARRVRVDMGEHPALPGALLYLRSFPSGGQNRAKRGSANGWIASRSKAAWAALDVQDLVGLTSGCSGTPGSAGRDGRDGRDGQDGT